MEDTKLRLHRMSHWVLAVWGGVWGTCVAAPIAIAILWSAPRGFDWRPLPFAFCAGIGAGLICSVAVVVFFKVGTGAEGLRAADAWGRYRLVPWSMMRSVSRFNLGGVHYLRVFTDDGGGPLWLPLFLEDQVAFRSAVDEAAPDDNVVRAYFRESGA